MGQKSVYKINLTKIEGDGGFPCPVCNTIISPEDESGKTYDIINVDSKTDGSLRRIIVLCKKCRSKINIEGFEALDEYE